MNIKIMSMRVKMSEEEKKKKRRERRAAKKAAVAVPEPAKKLLADPKSLSELYKYVKTYFRAVGWTADTKLPGNGIYLKKAKFVRNKDRKSVTVQLNASVFKGSVMLYKNMSKEYTLENFASVKDDIVNILRQAKYNPFVKEDSVDKESMLKLGWKSRFQYI